MNALSKIFPAAVLSAFLNGSAFCAPPAPALSAKGHIYTVNYDNQGKEYRRQEGWTFEVKVVGRDYEIHLSRQEAGSQYDLTCSNDDVFQLEYTGKQGNLTEATARTNGFPVTKSSIVELLWFAFCSGPTLDREKQPRQLPLAVLKINDLESNQTVILSRAIGPAENPLPDLARIYATAAKRGDGTLAALPPPYDNGYLFLEYQVEAAQVLNGASWPKSMDLRQFVTRAGATNKDDVRLLSETAFRVDSFDTNATAVKMPEATNTAVSVFDYRFRNDGGNIDYPLRTYGWVPRTSPQYMKLEKSAVSEEELDRN